MAQAKIYCWANGLLEIGPVCPEGALPLVSGEEKELKKALDGLATLSYAGENLVPKSEAWLAALNAGDEEAAENAAYDAVMNFRARLIRALER